MKPVLFLILGISGLLAIVVALALIITSPFVETAVEMVALWLGAMLALAIGAVLLEVFALFVLVATGMTPPAPAADPE